MSLIVKIFFGLIFIYILGWVGAGDYRHELEQFSLYCNNVYGDNPIWPDYDNVGIDACKEYISKNGGK
jgi:hypothetical protein